MIIVNSCQPSAEIAISRQPSALSKEILLLTVSDSQSKGFYFVMPALATKEIIRLRYNLDIPAFVRAAVRNNLNKEKVLIYLHIITNTHHRTEKMERFVPIAKQEDLTRNEILIWLHLSYGGSLDPTHLSRKFRIPPCLAENALITLQEKGIITNGRVL